MDRHQLLFFFTRYTLDILCYNVQCLSMNFLAWIIACPALALVQLPQNLSVQCHSLELNVFAITSIDNFEVVVTYLLYLELNAGRNQ